MLPFFKNVTLSSIVKDKEKDSYCGYYHASQIAITAIHYLFFDSKQFDNVLMI